MRIAYLATADARGHLMRAQLLTKALRASGAEVQVLTTSAEGVRFLAAFGIDAALLSPHYAVQFDSAQNMLHAATDRNVANYVFRPSRMLRDIARLRRVLHESDVVIDDSFHPALIVMGCLPRWRRKVVHVYGAGLRHALQGHFASRRAKWLASGFGRAVGAMLDRSRARIDHDFRHGEAPEQAGRSIRLPTPVAVAVASPSAAGAARARTACVYLNPHFRDPALAAALERGLADAGFDLHLVGEGYAGRGGWAAHDACWVDRAADCDLIVSAPGLAALSVAQVYRRPILLVLSDQPEQRINAGHAAAGGLAHRTIVWAGDAQRFADTARDAARALFDAARQAPSPSAGRACASARLQSWVSTIRALA